MLEHATYPARRYGELSNSSDFGGTVYDSYTWGLGGGLELIITPADAGKVLYFNYRLEDRLEWADDWYSNVEIVFQETDEGPQYSIEGGIPANIPFRTEEIGTSMVDVSMTSLWGKELQTSSPAYPWKNIKMKPQGFSLPIHVPANLNENRGLAVTVFDSAGQQILTNDQELSGSRTIGSEVISTPGRSASANVILTPADAGRVIYYNFYPSSGRWNFDSDFYDAMIQISFQP